MAMNPSRSYRIFQSIAGLAHTAVTRPFAALFRGIESGTAKARQRTTELGRIAESRRESEQKWRNILVNTPQIGLSLDPDARIVFANKRFLELTGWTEDEVLGRDWFDTFIPGEIRDEIRGVFRTVMRTGSTQGLSSYENEILTRAGERRHVAWSNSVTRDVSGSIVDVTCLGIDLSERKYMEAELRKAAARYRRLEENVPAIIYQFQMTPEGEFSFPYISEAVAQLAGVSASDVMGDASSILGMIPAEEQDAFRRGVRESATALSPYHAFIRIVKDGRDVWVECRATPERQSDGSVLWDGVFVDVTKEQEHRGQLRLQTMVLDQIADRVTVTDTKGVITYVNAAEAVSLGFNCEDLIGVSVENYGDDPDRGATQREIIQRTLEEGQWRGEVVNFAADGSEIIMDCRTHVIRDTDGKPMALAGISTDITERKKADEALRKREDQLNEAMKMAHAGYWEYDVAADTFSFNDNFYSIFGTTSEEVGGYQMSSAEYATRFCHPDDVQVVAEETRAAVQTADPNYSRRIEHRILYSDGEVGHIAVRFFIVKDSQGHTVKTYGVNQDITEHKRAEEKIRLALERRQREAEVLAAVALNGYLTRGAVRELAGELTEAAARALQVERVGVWLFDKEEKELVNVDKYVLSTGEHSSGGLLLEKEYRNEFEALKEAKYVAADDPLTDPRTAGYVEGYLKPNRITAMLDAVIRRGGRSLGTLCFEHVDRPHHWEEDEISFACQLADQMALTVSNREYRQVEREKLQIEEQYYQAQKVESIGRLAGGVAHDLNNLLSPILGYAEMLREDMPNDDRNIGAVNEILNAGIKARDLISQLLAFSRKQTLELKRIDVNKVLESFSGLLRRTIREDIEIKYYLASTPLTVMADVRQLEQVIMNIAVNAADAMPNGGELSIETTRAVLDEEYATMHKGTKPGEYLLLTFSDTGFGMDGDTLENVFEPFFSTKGEQGTGLGLATVYGIVKQHDGNIWVYSEPGRGTTFKIYLPLAAKSDVLSEADVKPATRLKGSEWVLLVEDNEQVRHLAESILGRQGYSVLVAKDGDEALKAAARHDGPLHLLLTDVVMPGMNGRELFERLSTGYPDIRVLYMSGYTANVITHSGILDEGIQFIQKPFTVNDLAEKVRLVLDDRAPRF